MNSLVRIGTLFAGLLLLFAAASMAASLPRERITFVRTHASVLAERADTAESREKGLMDRAVLKETDAMIFYLERSDYHSFWMYRTRIPLGIIFVDEAWKIVDIQKMVPCTSNDSSRCPVYVARAKCTYAIEVNPKFLDRHAIRTGDTIIIGR